MAKARPKTGEKRKTNQPLKIDQLPEAVRAAITYLRNKRFKTWEQIEELSGKPYSKEWDKDGGGFIDWPSIDADLLDAFPGLKLPKSSLHRWYDLRVAQVQTQVLAESETARAFAAKFSGAGIDDANNAVINAMRDEVFTLAGKMDAGSRAQYMDALNGLTLAMSRIQRVQMQSLKVKADIAKSETERARIAATSGDPREVYLRAVNDLLKKLRTREAVRAVLDPIKDELVQEMSHGAESFARQVQASAA
jgi:hypothetical protein